MRIGIKYHSFIHSHAADIECLKNPLPGILSAICDVFVKVERGLLTISVSLRCSPKVAHTMSKK